MANQDDILRIDQEDRHETLRLISWWDQERLARSKVLVVGAGALGNEAIKNLVLLGVGHIAVVDMDRIETSNLSRSIFFRDTDQGHAKAEVLSERAGDLDPRVKINAIVGNVLYDVGMEWFAEADIVLGCLDNREARLWVNRICWHVGTPWIDAGIHEISGVVQVFQPPDGTCYECGMKEADYRLINRRYSCPLLSEEDIQQGRVPTAPTIGSMIAAWQVQEALKLLHQLPTRESSALVVHGLTNHVYQTRLPRREDCLSHDPWSPSYRFASLHHQSTVGDLFQGLQAEFGESPLAIRLIREVVTKLECLSCGDSQSLLQLRGRTSSKEAICPNCKQIRTPHFLSAISHEETSWHSVKLNDLGIPKGDWIPVEFGDGTLYLKLADTVFPGFDKQQESPSLSVSKERET